MKRILFFLTSVLISVICFSQVYQKVSTPYQYRWFITDSVIATPYGEIPVLRQVGNTTRPGALFTKTFEGDTSLKLWTGYRWKDVGGTGGTTTTCVNGFTSDVSVTYSGTGFTFNIQGTTYNIDCIDYAITDTTITLSASDPSLNRVDKFYVGTDQLVHVAEGVPGDPALEPQLDGDQLSMAFVSIPAGSTTPGLTQQIVFDENTESVVTNLGTTTDPNNTTNVFLGTKSVNVTNINDPSGASVDAVYFDKAPPLSSWNIVGVDGLSMHILLKAVMPAQGNLRVQLFVGTTAVSSEVIVGLNKSNITTYQAITIPIGSFGTITNANITRVRFRYTRPGNTTNYSGFYIDYIFFEDGIGQPTPGGGVASVGLTFSGNAFQVTNTPVTSSGILTVTPLGISTEYINGAFNRVAFPTFATTAKIGILDARSKSANGLVIDTDSLYAQTVDYTYPGLTTPAMKMKWDSSYYIQNLSSLGDSLIRPLNDSTTGVKGLVAGTNVTLTDTDSTIVINSTGGAGGGRFGVSGEDDAAGETRSFTLGANPLSIFKDEGGGTTNSIEFNASGNLELKGLNGGDNSNINVNGTAIAFFNSAGFYSIQNLTEPSGSTNKMMVWDSASNVIKVTAMPAGGGGGAWGSITGTLSSQTDLQTALNLKSPLASPTFTGTVTIPTPFTLGAVSVLPTGTELNFVDGVTSAIQTQIDGKASTALSNLASVAINTSLISDADNTDDLGSASISWKDIYSRTVKLDGATSGTVTINSDALSNTLNGTTLSGTGIVPATMFIRPTSDFTLANSTSDQTAFGSTLDVWTLAASTSYFFQGEYYITHGAVSHALSIGFTLAGGASVTSINYSTELMTGNVNTVATAQSTTYITQTASTAVNLAGANGIEYVKFSGWMNVNAGGTFTPIIKFSVDPTGTCLMKAGSYIMFTPMGTNTVESIGSAN